VKLLCDILWSIKIGPTQVVEQIFGVSIQDKTPHAETELLPPPQKKKINPVQPG